MDNLMLTPEGRMALREGRREAIKQLLALIDSMPDKATADCAPVRHFFAPGVYVREMTMPVGYIIIGKIHRTAHLSILSKGKLLLFTEQSGVQEVSAPCTMFQGPYVCKVGYVLEEAVFSTIHATDKTDPADIEREITTTDFGELPCLTS